MHSPLKHYSHFLFLHSSSSDGLQGKNYYDLFLKERKLLPKQEQGPKIERVILETNIINK